MDQMIVDPLEWNVNSDVIIFFYFIESLSNNFKNHWLCFAPFSTFEQKLLNTKINLNILCKNLRCTWGVPNMYLDKCFGKCALMSQSISLKIYILKKCFLQIMFHQTIYFKFDLVFLNVFNYIFNISYIPRGQNLPSKQPYWTLKSQKIICYPILHI